MTPPGHDAPSRPSVRLEVDGGVATLRLDRPPLNVLDARMQRQLIAAAREAEERDDIRAVVLYGGERVFAAGADVKEMAAMDFAQLERHSRTLQELTASVARIGKPTVAALTGYALGGGCEIALAADVRFAADDVRLGLPEIALGIIPGAGGTQRLARLVGASRAKSIILTGEPLGAERALAIGLVDEVHPAEAVYRRAREWAAQFAHGPAIALRAAKSAIDRGAEVDLQTGLDLERAEFAALFATDDQRTGMASFIAAGPGRARFAGR